MAEIWIVEDDPAIGTLIEMTVKKAGHVTRRVPDAERLETVLRYADKKPDLLLLDLMLRRKNGYTVLEEWKADPATRLIPAELTRQGRARPGGCLPGGCGCRSRSGRDPL